MDQHASPSTFRCAETPLDIPVGTLPPCPAWCDETRSNVAHNERAPRNHSGTLAAMTVLHSDYSPIEVGMRMEVCESIPYRDGRIMRDNGSVEVYAVVPDDIDGISHHDEGLLRFGAPEQLRAFARQCEAAATTLAEEWQRASRLPHVDYETADCQLWCTERHGPSNRECCSDINGVDVDRRSDPGNGEASRVCVRIQQDEGQAARIVVQLGDRDNADAEVYMPADKAAALLQLLNHAVAQVTA